MVSCPSEQETVTVPPYPPSHAYSQFSPELSSSFSAHLVSLEVVCSGDFGSIHFVAISRVDRMVRGGEACTIATRRLDDYGEDVLYGALSLQIHITDTP